MASIQNEKVNPSEKDCAAMDVRDLLPDGSRDGS